MRDASGETKPCEVYPPEWGTGMDRDGNSDVSVEDVGLVRLACVGVSEDGDWMTLSESLADSSIFTAFFFDFFVSISLRFDH